VHTIAAISAPSALALRIAAEHDVAVWGFVREGQGNRYL
jgi:formate dehydrogenase assembly factor FdhD